MNPELIEKKPEYAQVVQDLLNQFERGYDLTKQGEQATLVEGAKQLAIIAVTGSVSGNLSVEVGSDGIRRIIISTVPITS